MNDRLISASLLSVFLLLFVGCSGSGGGDSISASGLQISVSVRATDPKGHPLTFSWRSTDGVIVDANSPSTTWRLPAGRGLHFAYVLVGNGHGGYTERRVAVSTDDIGLPVSEPVPRKWSAPAAPPPSGVSFSSIVRSGSYNDYVGYYRPGVRVYLENVATGTTSAVATTDSRGSYTIHNLVPGAYRLWCSSSAAPYQNCASAGVSIGGEAVNDKKSEDVGTSSFVGRLVLDDGSPCGTVNEFFGKSVQGKVTVVDNSDIALSSPVSTNAWGYFAFPSDLAAAVGRIKFECEGATGTSTPFFSRGNPVPISVSITAAAAPIVSGMSAKLQGAEVGDFLPPPATGAGAKMLDPEFFLSFKGIDSRLSACMYYQAVGAVDGCGSAGELINPISFNDWKKSTGMAPFARSGATEYTATFINRVDLNLTRVHRSVSYGQNELAAVVCNHLGPTAETQGAETTAISNAVSGRNLVACVAMDHAVTPLVNGGSPFTRFLIFGPSGDLLPSINLDGRREKFVPGVCVACHGGDRYAGRFPTDGTGSADIGARFLPYDTGNFSFSAAAGLGKGDQQIAIHDLNINVLSSDPNLVTQELIAGWYAPGSTVLNETYLPTSWSGRSALDDKFYRFVYQHSCRTCHVAFTETLNFDHYANLFTVAPAPEVSSGVNRTSRSCDGQSFTFMRNFSMPNSLRTHDLFWGSQGAPIDLPKILGDFVGQYGTDVTLPCTLRVNPFP